MALQFVCSRGFTLRRSENQYLTWRDPCLVYFGCNLSAHRDRTVFLTLGLVFIAHCSSFFGGLNLVNPWNAVVGKKARYFLRGRGFFLGKSCKTMGDIFCFGVAKPFLSYEGVEWLHRLSTDPHSDDDKHFYTDWSWRGSALTQQDFIYQSGRSKSSQTKKRKMISSIGRLNYKFAQTMWCRHKGSSVSHSLENNQTHGSGDYPSLSAECYTSLYSPLSLTCIFKRLSLIDRSFWKCSSLHHVQGLCN